MFEITLYAVSSWVIALIVFFLSTLIFLGSKDYSARAFALFIFFVALWIFNSGFFFSTTSAELAAFFMRSNHFIGSLAAISFYFFCFVYPEDRKPVLLFRLTFASLGILLIPLFYVRDIVTLVNYVFTTTLPLPAHTAIPSAFTISGPAKWGWTFAQFDIFFYIIFFGFWFAGLATLFTKYTFIQNTRTKQLTKHMFIAMVVGLTPVGILNAILPEMSIFTYFWHGIMSTLGWLSIISYSIMKHGQMNVRAVYAELLVFALILILFVSIFI